MFRKEGQITKKIGLANNTRPDIAFAVNLHARHNASPTKRHWIGIKNVLRYIHGTADLDLFYGRNQDPKPHRVHKCWLSVRPPQWKVSNWVCILNGGIAIS
jgi:hypothetical protein